MTTAATTTVATTAAATTTAVATTSTTVVPTTEEPPPTQAPAPSANTVCAKLQDRSSELACAPTALGPVWISAPFSQRKDQIALLPPKIDTNIYVRVGDTAIVGGDLAKVSSFGQHYWCVGVGIVNNGGQEIPYNLLEFSLLTPTGNLLAATVPLVKDTSGVLTFGRLAAGGYVTGGVCFNEPSRNAGRFALVYDPIDFNSDGRGLFYFDQ